jgi:protein-disulfide isomerase
MHVVVEELSAEYGEDLRVEIRNFPLDMICNPLMQSQLHESACFASELVRCAGEQGLFWNIHRMLFTLPELEDGSTLDAVQKAALKEFGDLGGDVTAVTECLDSDRQIAAIRADIELGSRIGVSGTPKFFVNEKYVPQVHPQVLRQIFDGILVGRAK